MKTYTDTQKLNVTDLKVLLKVSYSTAYRRYCDIKEHFNVETVLYSHFKSYFNVPK